MLGLLRRHPRELCFAALLTFLSGWGQTFFLGLLVPGLRQQFDLGPEQFSGLYSLATFVASLSLPYWGKQIDSRAPMSMALFFLLGIAAAYSLFWLSSWWGTLFVAYVFVRAFGQTGLPLTSSTYLSKKFGQHRGKSLAFAGLGLALAESVLPLGFSGISNLFGFEKTVLTWLGLLFVAAFLVIFLLSDRNHYDVLYAEKKGTAKAQSKVAKLALAELLRMPKTVGLFMGALIYPFVVTGLFFQQDLIRPLRSWSSLDWGEGFIFYGVFQMLSSLSVGAIIDRKSARHVLPFILVPLFFALSWLCLPLSARPGGVYVFFSSLGISAGMVGIVKNALIPEVYGLEFVGRIKSWMTTWMVISTSLAPFLFAWAISSFGVLFLCVTLLALCTAGLALFALLYFLFDPTQRSGAQESPPRA